MSVKYLEIVDANCTLFLNVVPYIFLLFKRKKIVQQIAVAAYLIHHFLLARHIRSTAKGSCAFLNGKHFSFLYKIPSSFLIKMGFLQKTGGHIAVMGLQH